MVAEPTLRHPWIVAAVALVALAVTWIVAVQDELPRWEKSLTRWLNDAPDWVALPVPAMLMEAACTSGVLSANGILESEGLCQEPVYTVPPRGLLAGRGKGRAKTRRPAQGG